MTMDPMEFSRAGDRAFSSFVDSIPHVVRKRHLATVPLDAAAMARLRAATARFLATCLGLRQVPDGDKALFAAIERGRAAMVNLTPNGMVTPKLEHTSEINALHAALVAAFDLGPAFERVEEIHVPLNLRINFGESNFERDERPYATNKFHSDVWAGEPLDAVVAHLPLFGDIDRLGVEFGEMPAENELASMRTFTNFEEPFVACGGVTPYEGVLLAHGHASLADARLLHRTRRDGPGMRISIDFRFRVRSDGAYRQLADTFMSEARRKNYVSVAQWRDVGRRQQMVFSETMAEAAARHGTNAPSRASHPTECRLVDV